MTVDNQECESISVDDENSKVGSRLNKTRKILAQFLAGTGNSLLVLGLGAAINVSTIVIASLSSDSDVIKATDSQISWIGSLVYICQPIGSLFSGTITEAIGRKKALMVINLPTIIAWIMMWWTQDLVTLFIAIALFGLGTGLTEAPTISYIGEICEPSLRGVLAAYVSLFTSSGLFGVYLLGTVLPWRQAAAVCLSIPLFTILMVSLIPESPIWLLSKGRNEDALKALSWLRGWVKPVKVKKEFDDLIRYNDNSSKCSKCEALNTLDNSSLECPHKKTTFFGRLKTKLQDLCQRETRRPLILSALYFAFAAMTGYSSIKPNLVNIFKAFNMTVDAHWATVGVGVLSIIGVILCMCLVKITGKRPIVLVSMASSCVSTVFLAKYAYDYIPHETSTYTLVNVNGEPSAAPLVWFVILVLSNSTGIYPISWLITTEIFPYKARGNALGIVAALSYIMNFIATKTYINLEKSLHIYGALYFYAAFTFVGLVYLYISLPETENRTHEEIEADFASDTVIFADDFIMRRLKSALTTTQKSKIIPINSGHTYVNSAFVEVELKPDVAN